MSPAFPKQKLSCHVPISVTSCYHSWGLGSDYISPLEDHYDLFRLSSQSQVVLGWPTTSPAGVSLLLSHLPPTPHGCLSTLNSLGHRFYSFINADLKISWHFWLLKNIVEFYMLWSTKTPRSLLLELGGGRLGRVLQVLTSGPCLCPGNISQN